MPPVRAVAVGPNALTALVLTDGAGTKTLAVSAIPAAEDTAQKVEDWINAVWLPANVADYQAAVHVFAIGPLRLTVGTWNLGAAIPPNWWAL